MMLKKNIISNTLIFFLFYALSYGQSYEQSPWHIVAKDINPSQYYGVTVANGMIGLVSSPEPLKVKDVVLNGVYDHYGRGKVSNFLKGFNAINMFIDVKPSNAPHFYRIHNSNISNYAQVLDMKNAALVTSFDVEDVLKVEYTMMALRNLPYTALVTLTLTPKEDIDVIISSVIEAPEILRNIRQFYSEIDRPHVKIPLLTSVAESPTGRHKVAVSNSFIFEEDHHHRPQLIHEDWDHVMHLAKFKKTLKKNKAYTVSIVSSMVSSEHYYDPQNEAERLSIFAMLEGKKRLLDAHKMAWDKLWQSDIEIQGDLQTQKDVRFALYHLYSFAREGTAYSLSPMGLSGLGYNGHVFWDTELWMYPPLLVMQPHIAKSLLEYRYERLMAARQNAFSHGFKGAMYPWESDDIGQESTPVWALTGPFQHHISGCIAWAFWQYYQVTKDKEWLKERGYPVLKEVADFWASRVERKAPKQYEINNVIGANEWQENIDNNAFTNAVAILSLRYATQAAKILKEKANPDWLHVADNIPILKFPDGVTRENATYDGVEIKQADVNLLAYPLKYIENEVQIRKDLEYYEPRMSPQGPAMGFSVLSTLYSRLGNVQKATDLYYKSYRPNEVPPFGVISETAGGTNPYFATGAGGMLQSVLFGFGGIDITDRGIRQLKTKLPAAWNKLILKGVGINEKTYTVQN